MLDKLSCMLCRPAVHVLCGVLCLLFFSWPMLSGIVGDDLPQTFVQLFVLWGIFIAVLFVLTRSCFIPREELESKAPPAEDE